MKTPSNKLYNIYIDTGGTFTDCIAEAPHSRVIRRKVLSSSALRGTAFFTGQPSQVRVELDYIIPESHFFTGCSFRFLDHPEAEFSITGSGEDPHLLTLKPEIGKPVSITAERGVAFEIQSPEEAPVLAARLVTGTPMGKPLPPMNLRLSTTRGTNALLERRVGKTLFLITEGFKDLLKIKNQQRPDLFSLHIQKPEPFYQRIVEVPERMAADGTVIAEPDLEKLREMVEPFLPGTEAAGICLMHSYLNPDHEIRIEKMLLEMGVPFVSRSSGLSSSIKMVPRAITTDVDACLTPVMQRYLNRIADAIGDSSFRIMNSAGSLVEATHYTPKDGLFSGPAGGVIGAAAVAKRALNRIHIRNSQDTSPQKATPGADGTDSGPGMSTELATHITKIISFDMGGTSTDVARYAGEIDYVFEHTAGDATLAAPAIEIETVAAGGGSVCGFDGKSLTAGPESAGADPGPACYGRGGPLTITDVNLLSGRLHPSNFHISISTEAARRALEELTETINRQRETALEKEEILEGFLAIANEKMAQAIRKISIQKGFDPSDYTLVAFGGAGGQHALAIAEKLNMNSVLVPSDAGLLSARGLQEARPETIASRQVLKLLKDVEEELPGWIGDLKKKALKDLMKQGVARRHAQIRRTELRIRLKGQENPLDIRWTGTSSGIKERFKQAYLDQYGHWIEKRRIEIESVRVMASVRKDNDISAGIRIKKPDRRKTGKRDTKPVSDGEVSMLCNGFPKQARLYDRRAPEPGTEIQGPALVLDPHSTTVIEPEWRGRLLEDGTWLLDRTGVPADREKAGGNDANSGREKERPEAVRLQLYTNRFRSVADQMGEMLRKTALSVNIRERLDYSCALLDADGYLVVNAPHIPVHLGAMGSCVRKLIPFFTDGREEWSSTREKNILPSVRTGLKEGDVLITNHPGYGGSHLPDVTVVTPVFCETERIGFVASRAHHAEIGGKRPGSMPPDATNLAEEGVVIPPMYLARDGRFYWEEIETLLRSAPWPSRSAEENMADIRAAVSANHRGAAELKKLADRYGRHTVAAYMDRLRAYASERMKMTLKKIPDGLFSAEERLDDGSLLKAACTVSDQSMSIDFTGSEGVHPGNLNANPSIVYSVVIYLLRLMVNEPLPLNDGLLEPVEITIPEGILNPPFPEDPRECPAVVGGNIETSQRLVDTLLKAFGLAACSYGTMNNVLFGNDTFGYYETVAGGTGAGDGFAGADAVHQHMTNTRATDPEILEHRYPVRLNRYAIRKNSGGDGRWIGGDGIVREMTFLEPVSLSVLSQHRVVPPYGLQDGSPGATGINRVIRKNGIGEDLGWKGHAELEAGDRFILHTPGGGGFGKP